MGDNLKKFFKKKKLDLTFSRAGRGHRLDEDTSKPVETEKPTVCRVEPSAEAKQAAAAALARAQSSHTPLGSAGPSLYQQMKAVVKDELRTRESDIKEETRTTPDHDNAANRRAAHAVYFRCPLLGDEVLTPSEWKNRIEKYVYSDDLNVTNFERACLILKNCNESKTKVEACTEILRTYLKNIINPPEGKEEQCRKIRISNKIFQEKVAPIKGTIELLESAGFRLEKLPTKTNEIEDHYVFPQNGDTELLKTLISQLDDTQKISLELDRNVQILQPSQAERRCELPPEFFRRDPAELKKEQEAMTKNVEMMTVLQTKAMRERQQKILKNYRYALIRVRFPDGIFLQGTFHVNEPFENVVEFVKENLAIDVPFSLLIEGKKLEDEKKTLLDLRLVPTVVMNFQCHHPTNSDEKILSYLKPDILALLQSL